MAPLPRSEGHGLPTREVHSPEQGNTIEKGKNIPTLCRTLTNLVFSQRDDKALALPFHPHFLHEQ